MSKKGDRRHGTGRVWLKAKPFLSGQNCTVLRYKDDTLSKLLAHESTYVANLSQVSASGLPMYTVQQREEAARKLYSPLLKWETRLVLLFPGNRKAELVADLVTVTLTHEELGLGLPLENRMVEYEALSYTWGYPDFTHTLLCNGIRLPITANLDEALRHLRRSDEKRFVWIDAICINQLDLNEKSQEVSKLFMVFRRASNVIAWLGSETSTTTVALTYIIEQFQGRSYAELNEYFPREPADHIRQQRGPKEDKKATLNKRIRKSIATEQLQNPKRFQTVVAGMFDVLRRPWLRRAWVAQEVCAAKSISLHIGSLEMGIDIIREISHLLNIINDMRAGRRGLPSSIENLPWNELDCLNEAVGFLSNFDLNHPNENTTIEDVDFGESALELQSPSIFAYRLLQKGQHLLASDDRDRVFALLNIAMHQARAVRLKMLSDPRQRGRDFHLNAMEIAADYSKPIAQVYAETTKVLINVYGNYSPLYLYGLEEFEPALSPQAPRLGTLADLPSWAQDWRQPRCFQSVFARNSSDSGTYNQLCVQDVHASNVLQINGYIFGRILDDDDEHLESNSPTTAPDGHASIRVIHTPPVIEGIRKSVQASRKSQPRLQRFPSPSEMSSQWEIGCRNGPVNAGDVLVVTVGSAFPFVLRQSTESSSSWQFIAFAEVSTSSFNLNYVISDLEHEDLLEEFLVY